MDLGEFSPNDHDITRILNALWNELYPAQGGRPKSWHPPQSQVRRLDLRLVHGIGAKVQNDR
jgi:hypothetical protein